MSNKPRYEFRNVVKVIAGIVGRPLSIITGNEAAGKSVSSVVAHWTMGKASFRLGRNVHQIFAQRPQQPSAWTKQLRP